MESKFNKLQAEIDTIEEWLNEHLEHPRNEEGYEKMREKLRELNDIWVEMNKPKQKTLFY